jgi:hypothetical protein
MRADKPIRETDKSWKHEQKKRAQQNLRELEDVRSEAVAQQEDKRRWFVTSARKNKTP